MTSSLHSRGHPRPPSSPSTSTATFSSSLLKPTFRMPSPTMIATISCRSSLQFPLHRLLLVVFLRYAQPIDNYLNSFSVLVLSFCYGKGERIEALDGKEHPCLCSGGIHCHELYHKSTNAFTSLQYTKKKIDSFICLRILFLNLFFSVRIGDRNEKACQFFF